MGIKKKIVAGFLLLLALIFVAVFSVYKLATQLSPTDQGISSSVRKLTLTSNLLSSLIEADGMARAFISTGDSVYFFQYHDQKKVTNALIDSLTFSSIANTNQFLRMLVVDSLVEMKNVTYNNYFTLRRNANPYRSVDLSNIGKRYDTIRVATTRNTSKNVDEVQPVVKDVVKKKGFFTRIWDNLTKKSEPDTIAIDESVPAISYDTVITYRAVRDTTLSQVRSQLRRIAAAESYERQQLAEREMQLVQTDQDIMNELRTVLLLFEKEEIAKAINVTEKSGKILNDLWVIALLLAASGLVTTIGFIVMIWKDLAKSAFYRRQSEQARALAESLLKVKEQFLANMSHEIRTPLTSIIGFTERLSESRLTKEQSRYIRRINSSSEHLLELINDLLDFSRIGSGKLTLEAKAFNPAELFEQAYETLSQRAKDKGLEIILKQNIPPVNLTGDPLRLRQVILNLLGNSIKFTEKGKIMLQTKGILSENGKTVSLIIRIADTGIGIPDDKLNIIFEEFSQVDHSITRKYGGSGLGLTISRKLVELMNGTITVLSRTDQGTIFTIKLVLPVSDTAIINSAPVVNSQLPDLKKVKILLAEDDETTNTLITEFLEKLNGRVYPTTNGLEAIKVFNANPGQFAIVITDIRMPGLSGPQLIHEIKETCREANIKTPEVIGLTAHADFSERESYIESGMNHFILKPFKNRDLIEVLNTIIAGWPVKTKTASSVSEELSFTKGATLSTNIPPVNQSNGNGENYETETISLTNFREFAGDDEDSLNIIMLSLRDNIKRTSAEIQAAFDKKDFAGVSLLAHRILPNIRLLGADKTAAIMRELEIISKEVPVNASVVRDNLNAVIHRLNILGEKLMELSSSKR